MKISGCLLVALFALSVGASGQSSFDLSGGYSHITEDVGQNGYSVGAAGGLKNVQLAFDYDRTWGTSNLGNFVLTNIGLISTKSRMQNFLAGPRFFFPSLFKNSNRVGALTFFAETEFGESYLRETLDFPTQGVNTFSNDHNFAWLLGGGADYVVSPHFLVRFKGDLFRTHFASEGQSHFRLALQVVYTVKSNKPH